MNPQTDLEIKGSLYAHPFAELLAEIAQARLNGSLRISDKEKKRVVYFKGGSVVFAVSNARTSRLFAILLHRDRLTKDDLGQIPNFANDIELSEYLKEKNFLTKLDCDRLFSEQIEGIIVDLLSWSSGDWSFSSLARIRDGLAFEIKTTELLIDFGRCMAVNAMLARFRSLDESFGRTDVKEIAYGLKPEEAFVLSRADDGGLTAAGLVSVAAMSQSDALQAIYTLWLGGLLVRHDWQQAFPKATISAMRNTKLELKTEAKRVEAAAPDAVPVKAPPLPVPKEPDPVISLSDYLDRVEKANTHYDILGVDVKADAEELKLSYFGLAKMFHPDRYHAEGGQQLKRIQHAFTELAQAHETLKNPVTREVYDYRMRKELAEREKREAAGNQGREIERVEQAAEHFARGYNLLIDEEYDASLPFFARAVHFAPKNARYHAYFGRALASDEKQRHKAEAEMQTALRLDPNEPAFRIMLTEFFIQYKLLKRAEGELTRLLAKFPSNREGRELLVSLQSPRSKV